MGIIRFLIGAVIVMLILLVIVPRTAKDEELERKAIRIISSICGILIVCIGVALYYFRDVILSDPVINNPTLIAIQTNNTEAKRLLLSAYLAQNFSPEDLAEALKQNSNIEALILRRTPAAYVESAMQALQQHPTLHTIEAKRLDDDALKALFAEWKSLPAKTIILKNYPQGDEICQLGAQYLNQTQIEHLILEKNQITDNASQALATLLNKNLQLRSLHLKENKLNDKLSEAFGEAIAQLENLESLDLSLNKLGQQGIKLLAPGLKQTTQLKKLNLSYNLLDDDAFIALADILKKQRSIEYLQLQRNQFSDVGARAIADALKVNQTIRLIVIRSKFMTRLGEEALRATLEYFPERSIELGMTRNEKSFRDEP